MAFHKGLHVMVMAFLLIMIVDGTQVPGDFHFRNVHRCSQFAQWLSDGTIKPVQKRRMNSQANISAYCIPVTVSLKKTTFYD